MKSSYRAILFWLFIFVEFILLIRFIFLPIFKLIGLQKGISDEEASKIIGNHFPEVGDKLLNVLQLGASDAKSELLIASIEQKSKELQPIPFKKAINFKTNVKYLRYAAFPLGIIFITLLTGDVKIFNDSLDRVVQYKKEFEPPAPFKFHLLHENLSAVEGSSLPITLEIIGDVQPENVEIHFDGENYLLAKNDLGAFQFTFQNIQKPVDFYFEANRFSSKNYKINLVNAPVITDFEMLLSYPAYTNKKKETIKNTGNIVVPEGTNVKWIVKTNNTENVAFNSEEIEKFSKSEENNTEYFFQKRIFKPINYTISSSNKALKDYEVLQFSIETISDASPKIDVITNIDSISRGPAFFKGQVSDDYGISKLQLVYFDEKNPENQKTYRFPINTESYQQFQYVFPQHLEIEEGISYAFYFEVFDNDILHGNKSAKTQTFSYYKKTQKEVQDELIKEQKESIDKLQDALENTKENSKELKSFEDNLQKSEKMQWSDKKKLEQFLKRHEQYNEMLEKQAETLKQNFQEQKSNDLEDRLKEDQEAIEERLKEAEDLEKQKKLLEELKKLSEKLNKEDLVEKLKQLAKQQEAQEQSLERVLELTKRFYVEQKANDIANKLEELAKKQEELAENKEDKSLEEQKKAQDELAKEFEKQKKALDELRKDNEDLKQPMQLPDTKFEENQVSKELDKIEKKQEEQLKNQENSNSEKKDSQEGEQQNGEKEESEKQNSDKQKSQESPQNQNQQNQQSPKKNQKKASQQMQNISMQMMQAMMQQSGEMIEENIETLRLIVENLLTFSFEQEDLMERFQNASTKHPSFASNIKLQQKLKQHFEHIDDSLYVLSLRTPKLSNRVLEDVSNIHYYIENSFEHFTENQYQTGLSDQQFIITGANNLALLLSELLNNMQMPPPFPGQGKGNSKGQGKSFSLPDIIKQHDEMMQQMQQGKKGKEGQKPGEQQGDGQKGGKGKQGQQQGGKQQGKSGQKGGQSSGQNGQGNQNGEDGNSEAESERLYEIYKQQAKLRQALEDYIAKNGKKGKGGNGSKAVTKMKQLEKQLLDKGVTESYKKQMQLLKHELLKLQKAEKEQGKDSKRESNTNKTEYDFYQIDSLNLPENFYNKDEILQRQSLPLQSIYKKKVQEYFQQQLK
ncbi:DUF4175 family protein [Aureivirga marina]|uniref:DUF4175 family protein n=1 Tax=Aureivirga marina TaxID=1182451 RepID=UPI0018C9775A|nr:DUF4175 family protein [Aureivirga marina]